MSIIDESGEEAAGSSVNAPPESRPLPDRPTIKLRHKKHGKVDNGRLRPTSIHIFEDLEKNGVIPDQALSSYKVCGKRRQSVLSFSLHPCVVLESVMYLTVICATNTHTYTCLSFISFSPWLATNA